MELSSPPLHRKASQCFHLVRMKNNKISVIAYSEDEVCHGELLVPQKRFHNNKRLRVSNASFVSSGPYLWMAFITAFCVCVFVLEVFLKPYQSPPSSTSPCFASDMDSSLLDSNKISLPTQTQSILLPSAKVGAPWNMTDEEKEFWSQPNSSGYKPCMNFSSQYVQDSRRIAAEKRKVYLMVVVNGGLNQQRNQIVDAVVMARILEATLVLPILQVNQVWEDDSEFSDIFDTEHFKSVLKNDVKVVTTLPSSRLLRRPVQENGIPFDVTPAWIKAQMFRKLRRQGVMILKGLDSRLSKDLPSDLQKLRCKVAFQALRFAESIQSLGDKIAERMSEGGPYIALHLRLEKDVWVRTGCLPGLSAESDRIIEKERKANPSLLTSRSNLTAKARRLYGLCPLTANEVARLLKALGASSRSRIYWAGGQAFGGETALKGLREKFPNIYNKWDVATADEVEQVKGRASLMAAVDYVVALRSDVFMASHGGNMGRALHGHRAYAYAGHKKHIIPNKREIIKYLDDKNMDEQQFVKAMRDLHNETMGQPSLRTDKPARDVLAHPVPNCMCPSSSS